MTDKSPIEELKQRMVENFLGWKLPVNFNPDGGIIVDREVFDATGTNLFTYEQVREMVDFMLTGVNREEEHRKSVEAAKGIQKSFEELGRKQEQMEQAELIKRIDELEARIEALVEAVFPVK